MTDEAPPIDRERALVDLPYFGREVMGYNYFETPEGKKTVIEWEGEMRPCGMVDYGPQGEMSKALMGGRDVFIMASRGGLKTTHVLTYVIQQIIKNPDIRVLLHMETLDKAKESVDLIKRKLESEAITDIWGEMRGPKWTNDSIIVQGRTIDRRDATLFASGTDKVITGNHVDLLVIDDPVSWQQALSPQQMEKAITAYQMLTPILDPGGRTIITMTPYDEQDLHGHILRNERDLFDVLELDCGMEAVKGMDGEIVLEGTPKFPNLPEKELNRRLQKMLEAKFNTQYALKLQNPADQLFERTQFQPVKWADVSAGCHFYLLTDTAVTDNDAACFSVLAMVGLDSLNNAFLADMDIGKWDPATYVKHFLGFIDQWNQKVRVRGICMETTSANKVYRTQIDEGLRKLGLSPTWYQPTRGGNDQSKNNRIRSLSPRFQNRKFYVVDDTMRRGFRESGEDKVLWNPRGHVNKEGRAEPDGELVRQFLNFKMRSGTAVKDIPDCLADIDLADRLGGHFLPRPTAWDRSEALNQQHTEQVRSLGKQPGQRLNFKQRRSPRGWDKPQ